MLPTARPLPRLAGPPMSHTLAIDLGTGSCRALVFDLDGRPVATSQREWSHPPVPGVPGSQSLRHESKLAADRGLRPRGASRQAGLRRPTSRPSRQRACARGWSCTTPRATRSGPARTSTRGRRARPTSWSAPASRRRSTASPATGSRSPRRPASGGSAITSRRSSRRSPTWACSPTGSSTGSPGGSSPIRRRARARISSTLPAGPGRPTSSTGWACPPRSCPRSSSRAPSSVA